MDFRELVAKNINELIRVSGKSKTQVANELRVKPATVTEYTSGKALPSLEKAKQLCVILTCTYEDIMGPLE